MFRFGFDTESVGGIEFVWFLELKGNVFDEISGDFGEQGQNGCESKIIFRLKNRSKNYKKQDELDDAVRI